MTIDNSHHTSRNLDSLGLSGPLPEEGPEGPEGPGQFQLSPQNSWPEDVFRWTRCMQHCQCQHDVSGARWTHQARSQGWDHRNEAEKSVLSAIFYLLKLWFIYGSSMVHLCFILFHLCFIYVSSRKLWFLKQVYNIYNIYNYIIYI